MPRRAVLILDLHRRGGLSAKHALVRESNIAGCLMGMSGALRGSVGSSTHRIQSYTKAYMGMRGSCGYTVSWWKMGIALGKPFRTPRTRSILTVRYSTVQYGTRETECPYGNAARFHRMKLLQFLQTIRYNDLINNCKLKIALPDSF